MRATLVDRLLPMLEAYAAGRVAEKTMRRQMRAERCEIAARFAEERRCYLPVGGGKLEAERCASCKRRTFFWTAFVAQKAENRSLLARIERLALRLSLPDPVEPEEPKPLLDLMAQAVDPIDENRPGSRVGDEEDEPLAPCECGCGGMVPGGHLEAAHEEDYRS